MSRPAVFLDRDGVINENLSTHVRCWEDFHFIPGALEAIAQLTALGVPLVVVTNQAIVGRGLASQMCLDDIHRRMLQQIGLAGGEVLGVYACPHDRDSGCRCRKPEPGMLLTAAERFDLDLHRSILVGDWLTDISAGQRGGCQTVLVLTGRGERALREINSGLGARPTAVASDVLSAVPLVEMLLSHHETMTPHLPAPYLAPPTQLQDWPLVNSAGGT